MNLALSALLIVLLLLPAFSFRIGISVLLVKPKSKNDQNTVHDYISRNVGKALAKLNFTETVFLFSIVPIILHLVSLSIIYLFDCHIDYALLLNIFAGKPNVLQNYTDKAFHEELISFLLYTLSETVIAWVTGALLLHFLSGKKWVLKMLMGHNPWYKLFSGSMLKAERQEEIANVLVEALVETKESSVIYSGLLKHYELSDNSDELSCIILTGVVRRDLRKGQISSKDLVNTQIQTSTSYDIQYGDVIEIPGHSFNITGKEITNMSVTYFKRQEDPATKKVSLVPLAFDKDH